MRDTFICPRKGRECVGLVSIPRLVSGEAERQLAWEGPSPGRLQILGSGGASRGNADVGGLG